MRVIIIGAGMGGLALAYALHKAEIDVTIYERDADAEATGGYRLALDGRACEILSRHLPPARYQALQASSMPSETNHRLIFADHRLRPLSTATWDPTEEALLIGRVPLRRLLVDGLTETVRFGSAYASHTIQPDGTVLVRFADGSTDTADVLVGADGARSRVAASLAGRATSAPFGFGGLAARTPLNDATKRLLPTFMAGGAGLAIGPKGVGIFMTRHDAATRASVDPATCTDVAPITEAPALIWSVIALDTILPPETTRALDGPALIQAALTALHDWPNDLQQIVASADPTSAAYYPFNAADPDAELTPWPAGPVTAIGDAVHAMPPTAGRAASTAIRDADNLATELITAHTGQSTIALATMRFHKTMATYAPDAVRESLIPLHWMRRLSHPLPSRLAQLATPTAATIQRLRKIA